MVVNKFSDFIKNYFKFIILLLVTLGFGVYLGQNFTIDLDGVPAISRRDARAQEIKNQETPDNVDVDFSLFWTVWDRISNDYLIKDKVDPQKMFHGAIKGMVESLEDPYTVFLDPGQNEDFNSELAGTFEGVGIQLGVKDNKLVVIAPIDGSPAAENGVRAGDFILAIEDKDTTGLSLPEAVSKIRGAAGTEIKLTFSREGETALIEKTLKRATIRVKSVEVKNQGEVAVIKLSRFGDNTNAEWDEAVDKVVSDNKGSVILDLRNNPGGRLQSAVHIVSTFTDKNKIAVSQEDSKGNNQPLFTQEDGRLKDKKVVVLINKGSASASEIVAGALRDLKGTKLIGDTSFGKGTVQQVEPYEEGSGLHLTTSKWLTPKGTWVHDKGLEPDEKVEPDKADPTKDLQLNKALQVIRSVR